MVWETTASDVYETFSGNGWLPVAALALLVAFLSVALAYMLSVIFQLPDLKRWAKSEFYQAAASAMLVALIFAFVQGTSIGFSENTEFGDMMYSYGIFKAQNMTEVLAGEIVAPNSGGKTKPWKFARDHVMNMIDCARNKFKNEYDDVRLWEWIMFSQLSIKLWIEVPIPLQMILLPLYQVMIYHHMMANNYAWLALAMYFQLSFMQWAETAAFTVLLPIGVILRILPITRGAGGALIALAIALYVVYPLAFLVLAAGQPVPSGCTAAKAAVEQEEMCTKDPTAFVAVLNKRLSQGQAPIGASVSEASQMSLYAYFYPVVIVGIVLAFVRALGPLLGAEIADIGRGLFRLV